MKKKMVLMIAILAVSLCSCNPKTSTQGTTTPQGSLETQTPYVKKDIKFKELLPKIKKYFKNGKKLVIEPDGGEMYCVQINGVTKKEYKKYQNACEKAGFDQVRFKSDTILETRTSDDKYYLLAQFTFVSDKDPSKNYVKITSGVLMQKK